MFEKVCFDGLMNYLASLKVAVKSAVAKHKAVECNALLNKLTNALLVPSQMPAGLLSILADLSSVLNLDWSQICETQQSYVITNHFRVITAQILLNIAAKQGEQALSQ